MVGFRDILQLLYLFILKKRENSTVVQYSDIPMHTICQLSGYNVTSESTRQIPWDNTRTGWPEKGGAEMPTHGRQAGGGQLAVT